MWMSIVSRVDNDDGGGTPLLCSFSRNLALDEKARWAVRQRYSSNTPSGVIFDDGFDGELLGSWLVHGE